MRKHKAWQIECALLAALLIVGGFAYMTPFAKGCRDLYDNLLRLHVLANSDSETDQHLKLLVRDALLQESAEWFGGASSAREAAENLTPHFREMEQTAQHVLRENGCADNVSISLEKTYFETRTYGEYTVPAGNYTAVCVRIGEAKGHNWWCVMFPPLCLPAAEKKTDAVFTANGQAVLGSQPKYDVRFKIVEWVQKAKKR